MPPTFESNCRLAGIDPSITGALSVRAREATCFGHHETARLIIETCRNCEAHATCFRHDPRAFQGRFARIKRVVEDIFVNFAVEYLVPPDGTTTVEAPIRIGAFEVYLCVPAPCAPFGAVSL